MTASDQFSGVMAPSAPGDARRAGRVLEGGMLEATLLGGVVGGGW